MRESLTSKRRPATDGGYTFDVLGPLEVRDGSDPLDVPGRQERALLALLLTAPGRVFSVSAIVAGLWADDPPAGAERTVQSYVSRLRRALPGDGASLVITRSPGYLAAISPECVDAERFRALAGEGRRDLGAGRPEEAATRLQDALGLWRGEAFAEFDAPFAVAERTALEELRLGAVEDRITAELAMGAGPELVAELETLVGQHPWRERLWAQLMTALYRSGRQGDALGAFQRARASLVEELGIEPGPELRAVEAQVLAQDAALLAARAAPVALPQVLTVVGPTFVGREAELARLFEAYELAIIGTAQSILLTGPHGMGKTRLLAELAREVHSGGGIVCYGLDAGWPLKADVPVVILLDDLQRASAAELVGLLPRVGDTRPPLLLVGSCVWDEAALTAEQTAAMTRLFAERLPLPPLQEPDVAQIVGLYVSAEAVESGVNAVAAAGGVPLYVHAAASRYGEELVTAQVEEAAVGISGPRRHLSVSQERVADGVLDLQRIRLVRAAHAPVETPRVVCPYKGLAYFDVDDAPYFFGRERLVAQLVARLVDARLLAVVGASGSGKSSVVRAGLVAAVRAGMLPGSERWRVVLTAPTQPLHEPAGDGARLLLVVDQFEELFTALSPTQREEYAHWLAATAAQDNVTVVVAVRSDYYAQVAAFGGVADLLAANTVLVGEMTSDELQDAVELPAAAAGLVLEPGLAQTIAGDVAGEPGGLPLMSTALLSLWEQRDRNRLTLSAYHAMGGVRAAVARLAETAYEQLTPTQQAVARRILLRLAETGETGEPVRRRAPIGEVAPDGDADARVVLDTLAARRLLTVSDTHAEVAHEALLREWPRLRTWLDEDEAGRELRRHLAPAARDWQARDREAGELYRGARLAAALDWQRDHLDELTGVEHDFLRTSQDAAEAETLRRRRSIRRLRALAVCLAGVLALALIAGALAVNQRNTAREESLAADVRALQAAALSEDRWDSALLLAAQAQRFDDSADSRAALLQTVQRGPEATAMYTAGEALHSLVVSADGRRLVAGGSNGALFIWDTVTRQFQQIPRVSAFDTNLVDMSPDGRYLAAISVPVSVHVQGGLDWQLAVVDLEKAPPEVRYIEHETRGGPRFAADSRTIMDVHADGSVHYLDVETGRVLRTLDLDPFGGDNSFKAITGPENRRFAVAMDIHEGSGVAWEVSTGRQIWSATNEDVRVAAISPDGSRMVLGHADGQIERIDVRTGASTPVDSSLAEGLVDVTWAPDGLTFAGATQDRTVLVWNAETLEVDAVFRGHWGKTTRLAYSVDSTTLYAAGLDRAVLSWDLTGKEGTVTKVPGTKPTAGVQTTALAANGSILAVGYGDDESGRIQVSEIPEGRKFEIDVPEWPLNFWRIRADGQGRSLLLVLAEFESIEHRRLWIRAIDVRSGELLPYENKIELVYRTGGDAAVTGDNEAIVAVGNRQLGLWDLNDGDQLVPELYEAAGIVGTMGADSDGRLVALGQRNRVEVIDLRTGDLVQTLPHSEPWLSPLVFSPDGKWLAGATDSGRVIVWDSRSWRQHTWDAVPGFGVDSMVFTPDSDFLVTGGAGEAAIWNVEQGASGGARLEVDPTRRDASVLVAVPDDGTLITFTEGTGVREWDVSPDALLEHACALVDRNLTQDEWESVLPDRSYQRTCPEYPSG